MKAKYQVEIHIRGIRRLTKNGKKLLGQFIKEKGQQFKKEDLSEFADTFSYRLLPFKGDKL